MPARASAISGSSIPMRGRSRPSRCARGAGCCGPLSSMTRRSRFRHSTPSPSLSAPSGPRQQLALQRKMTEREICGLLRDAACPTSRGFVLAAQAPKRKRHERSAPYGSGPLRCATLWRAQRRRQRPDWNAPGGCKCLRSASAAPAHEAESGKQQGSNAYD